MTKKCILVIAHGSRRETSQRQTEDLVARFKQQSGEATPVFLAYLELAEPNYQTVLPELAASYDHLVIVPLTLFAAGHWKNDIPIAVDAMRRKHPDKKFWVARPFGHDPQWVNGYFKAAADHSPNESEDMLLVIGRGSSDADANGEFAKMSRLLGEGLGLRHLESCFVGITEPRLEDTLKRIAKLRPKRLFIVPFFFFTGVLLDRIQSVVADFEKRFGWVQCHWLPALGQLPAIDRIFAERIDATAKTALPSPCVSCQYRVPLGQLKKDVGGLRSLLWSVRHSFTHSQASPNQHAHANFKKHVLVCTNTDCVDRGALETLRTVRQELKKSGQHRDFRITRTSCMGRCGEGPTVAVYPDGVWYRSLTESGAKELVHDHLLKDRLVAPHVDNIM
jgi:sirohydrochlorin ferrochelatase/(2Fe-2S) ferredoxin